MGKKRKTLDFFGACNFEKQILEFAVCLIRNEARAHSSTTVHSPEVMVAKDGTVNEAKASATYRAKRFVVKLL